MQKDQKQTHHGGTGEEETETSSALGKDDQRTSSGNTNAGNDSAEIRNPSGDDIADAVDGDEGSGRRV